VLIRQCLLIFVPFLITTPELINDPSSIKTSVSTFAELEITFAQLKSFFILVTVLKIFFLILFEPIPVIPQKKILFFSKSRIISLAGPKLYIFFFL